jgi:hypothetical protein
LTTYRPDLGFFTLNCDWGLGIITGFHRERAAPPPSEAVLRECKSLDFALLEEKRKRLLRLHPYLYSYPFFHFRHPREYAQREQEQRTSQEVSGGQFRGKNRSSLASDI